MMDLWEKRVFNLLMLTCISVGLYYVLPQQWLPALPPALLRS